MSATAPALFHKMYMALAMLIAALVFLGAPRQAAAQNDVLRVLAERVMRERQGGYYDRDDARRLDQWERERLAREAYCRRNRNAPRCDDYNGSYGRSERRGDWCLDRDRNNRCDANDSRRDNGRHRGWDKDDWKRGRNGRR